MKFFVTAVGSNAVFALIEDAGSLTGVPTTLDYHKLILEIQV
jgi:hypothetical protein